MKINESDLKPVVYVAGRYSDGGTLNEEERWKNRNILRYFSVKFMKKGWAVICPIENDEWAYEDGVITYENFDGGNYKKNAQKFGVLRMKFLLI